MLIIQTLVMTLTAAEVVTVVVEDEGVEKFCRQGDDTDQPGIPR